MMSSKYYTVVVLLLAMLVTPPASGELIQITENFATNTDGVWDSSGNTRLFPQNFGWRNLDHAGTGAGVLGGRFQRTDVDSLAFYGFNVGEIGMNHAWSFSGIIRYVDNGSSSIVNIGYFSVPKSIDFSTPPSTNPTSGPQNWVGILWNNGSAPILRARDANNVQRANAQTLASSASIANGWPASFSLAFDPASNNALTLTVKEQSVTINLSAAVVNTFDPFTHFGVMSGSPANGWAEVYFDDLTFTASATSSALPEPGSVGVLGALALAVLMRRQRRYAGPNPR